MHYLSSFETIINLRPQEYFQVYTEFKKLYTKDLHNIKQDFALKFGIDPQTLEIPSLYLPQEPQRYKLIRLSVSNKPNKEFTVHLIGWIKFNHEAHSILIHKVNDTEIPFYTSWDFLYKYV